MVAESSRLSPRTVGAGQFAQDLIEENMDTCLEKVAIVATDGRKNNTGVSGHGNEYSHGDDREHPGEPQEDYHFCQVVQDYAPTGLGNEVQLRVQRGDYVLVVWRQPPDEGGFWAYVHLASSPDCKGYMPMSHLRQVETLAGTNDEMQRTPETPSNPKMLQETLPLGTPCAVEVSASSSLPSSECGTAESPELIGSPLERINAFLTYRHLAPAVPVELQTFFACGKTKAPSSRGGRGQGRGSHLENIEKINALLTYRHLAPAAPQELETLFLVERPHKKRLNTGEEVPDRAVFGTKTPSSRGGRGQGQNAGAPADEQTNNATMTPSANAYRPSSSSTKLDRDAELRRAVQGSLNKICPENVSTIAQQLGETKVETVEELQVVIGLIFKRALSEPDYCETYADLVLALNPFMPEFPSEEGGEKITFKATLLNVVQEEFESLPKVIAPTEEKAKDMDEEARDFWISQRKGRVLANMKFIGHLFLRQLLSANIVGFPVEDESPA